MPSQRRPRLVGLAAAVTQERFVGRVAPRVRRKVATCAARVAARPTLERSDAFVDPDVPAEVGRRVVKHALTVRTDWTLTLCRATTMH